MEKYVSPEMEVVELGVNNIVTSGGSCGDSDTPAVGI